MMYNELKYGKNVQYRNIYKVKYKENGECDSCDMLYILMLLSVIYFRYTTHSHCISSNSEGPKNLPDDGRLLPKHVGAST
jgi:hypothetical protein